MSRKLSTSPKMEFETKKIVRLFLIVLEWATFGGLMLGVAFFVQEVWRDYQSQVTTIQQYSELWEEIEPPTIVFCFNPPIKGQVLEKYNKTLREVLGYSEFETELDLLEEGFYQIGRDFNITKWGKEVKFGENEELNIEKIYTFWNGICYSIKPRIKLHKLSYYGIDIRTSKSIKTKYLPKINFFLTSNQTSHDIIFSQWTDGTHPLHIDVDLKEKIEYYTSLQVFKYQKLEVVSNCSFTLDPPIVCGAQK